MSNNVVQRVIALNDDLENRDWWEQHKKCFVRDGEFKQVQNYNRQIGTPAYALTLAYPFEAVIGNPVHADIIFFANNPSASQTELTQTFFDQLQDIPEEQKTAVWETLENQVDCFNCPEKFENKSFPSHCLNQNFTGLREYWTRILIGAGAGANFFFRLAKPELTPEALNDFIMKHTAFIELGGYHSTKFAQSPLTVGHIQQTRQIICKAIERSKNQKKVFVLLRGKKYWTSYIPELNELDADQYFYANSPQKMAFSMRNIRSMGTNDDSLNQGLLEFIQNLQ